MDQKIPLDRDSFEQIVATASILQQLHKRAEYLEGQARNGGSDLTALIETQQEIQTGSLSPEAALLRTVSLALKLVPARGAAVWLFAGDTLAYRAGAGTASDDEHLREIALAQLSGNSRTERCAETYSAISPAYKSLLIAPIFKGPGVAGALTVFSDVHDAFSPEHIATTRLLAGLAAHAIDKAATAQFKHMVSLERAVVLQVIESTVPRLSGLIDVKEHSFPGPASVRNTPHEREGSFLPHPFINFDDVMSPEALAQVEEELARYQEASIASSAYRPELREREAPTNEIRQPGQEIPLMAPAPILTTPALTDFQPGAKGQRVEIHWRALPLVLGIVKVALKTRVLPQVQAFLDRSQILVRDQASSSLFYLRRAATDAKLLASSRGKYRIVMRISFFVAVLIIMAIALRTGAPRASTQIASATVTAQTTARSSGAGHPLLSMTHKTVTDPEMAVVLQEMSAFEIPSLRRQAKYGDAAAAFQLGMAYETGRSVRQDCVAAAQWVREAANAGDAAAEYNLGLRYRDGDGVPVNPEESEKWIHKAAAQKYLPAETILERDVTNRKSADLSHR